MSVYLKSEPRRCLSSRGNLGDRKRRYKSIDFTVSKPMPLSDASKYLRQSRPKRAIYVQLIERIRALKANEVIYIPVPNGIDPTTLHNRINGACSEALKNPPKGCKYIKRTTADKSRIVILCVPAEGLFPRRE